MIRTICLHLASQGRLDIPSTTRLQIYLVISHLCAISRFLQRSSYDGVSGCTISFSGYSFVYLFTLYFLSLGFLFCCPTSPHDNNQYPCSLSFQTIAVNASAGINPGGFRAILTGSLVTLDFFVPGASFNPSFQYRPALQL